MRVQKRKNQQTNNSRSILFSNTANNDLSNFEFSPDECLLCNFKYNNNLNQNQQQREHLFSKQHLQKLIQFVTNIAVQNGANPGEFPNSNAQQEDELSDEENLSIDCDIEEESYDDLDNNTNEPQSTKMNGPFDVNNLLKQNNNSQTQQQSLYNYFLYSNLLNTNQSSASSTSSTCSSTSSTCSSSPSFYNSAGSAAVLAQIYAALAAQQQQLGLLHLDSLNLPKTVQFEIEKKLNTPINSNNNTIQYYLDGSNCSEVQKKLNLTNQELHEHVSSKCYICRVCKMVSLNRDQIQTHQCCLNSQMNLFKLEQMQYKCSQCNQMFFNNSSEFMAHFTKLHSSKHQNKRKDDSTLNNSLEQSVSSEKRFKY